MDASSLIFLAIIAVWAVYLLGHWVRRRDQLATTRSIDRFSDAMRVLERRTPVQAVVGVSSGAVVMSDRFMASQRPTSRSARISDPGRTNLGSRGSGAPSTAPVRAGGVPSPAGRSHRGISAAAAKRRARLLMLLGVATALSWVFVLVTTVPWPAAAGASGLLAGALAQLRRTARRRVLPVRARSTTREPDSVGADPARQERRRPRPQQDGRSVLDKVRASRRVAGQGTAATPTASSSSEPPSSLSSAGAVTMDADGPEHRDVRPAATDDGRRWQPVPVPPPTYTLKPKARPVMSRPAVAAALDPSSGLGAAQTVSPDPDGARTTPVFDLDEILERRIASGG